MREAEHNSRTADVLLISMPFGPLQMPSIGLGLLKGALKRDGVSVHDLYFTLDMAARIGVEAYLGICLGQHSTTDLLGEWIFERALHGSSDPAREREYLKEVIGGAAAEHSKSGMSFASVADPWKERLLDWRDQSEFLEACLEEVLSYNPRLVGFTSAFQQNIASLALARRIKERAPQTVICMGGSNCEGVMAVELLRQYPFLDAVLSGEGDAIFPAFVRAVLGGDALSPFPGLHHRLPRRALSVLQESGCSAPSVQDMDALPIPDYGGFFERFHNTVLDQAIEPHVLFESSRGCYWGAVSHCTFCGLNGGNMGYRMKSAARALQELTTLVQEHPGAPVTVVDNILSMSYFRDFVPALAEKRMDLRICYEVKANLTKEQVRLLAEAGIRDIQPGIESLSTPLLRLMKKGCTRLQNIQLLKWCRELDVRPIWNILWGFPQEDPAEYAAMAELMPALSHLHPPMSAAPLRLDRFSPMFDNAETFGCTEVRPYPSYAYVYQLPESALRNLAYYFRFDYADGRDPNLYAAGCREAVEAWRDASAHSFCFALDHGECLLIVDLRPASSQTFHALAGIDRLLYLACDSVQGVASLHRLLQTSGLSVERDEVQERLERVETLGLMLHEGNQWLSLALTPGSYEPPRQALRLTIAAAKAQAQRHEENSGMWKVAEVNETVADPNVFDGPPAVPATGLLTGSHVQVRHSREVWLDLSAVEASFWQETRLVLAGVGRR